MIPPDLNPAHVDYLKAKSKSFGGDTLAEHTWEVLSRLADQYRLRPNLAVQLGDERLWHRMYWGCFLHDFGKAAKGFQERLLDKPPENQWHAGRHRHEVLSLAFIDWLFPGQHPDRLPVICIIVSHHKDHCDIVRQYGIGKPDEDQHERLQFLVDQLAPSVVEDLWTWLVDYGELWREALGFPPVEAIQPMNKERFGVNAINRALSEFRGLARSYTDFEMTDDDLLRDVHYRGLILASDHTASAGVGELPPMRLTREVAERPLQKVLQWRSHQTAAAKSDEGSALMIAPTGSGKTEAALLWAAQQHELRPVSRLFYTLPYQASMNAMAERLCERFFGVSFDDPDKNQDVTIQHSRATLKFYQDMMNADGGEGVDPRTAIRAAKNLTNRARLNFYPVQVFSPYQMLKAGYHFKGYEALLVDYTNALFIFDEIHAYDPERLALIITLIEWLAERCGARFLVMTATLPFMVEQALKVALPGCAEIIADNAVFVESQRHTVRLLEGDMQHYLEQIAADFQAGESVLVCCNTVARAQMMYDELSKQIGQDHIMLLHGRFNGKDRGEKEKLLAKLVGVGIKSSERRPYVIVATQVVEVSLDIDLDTIYTDPAPLEALLQRFGRVNRGREKINDQPLALCPVHVFTEPCGEKESRPYDHAIVAASIDILRDKCDNKPIDEAQVTAMLREIYEGEIAAEWQRKYEIKADQFRKVLSGITPYESASEEQYIEFYKLFDGTQVLPVDCENDYYDALETGGYLAASQYLVNISWGMYGMFKQQGLVRDREEGEFADHVLVPYTSEYGLDIAAALAVKDEDV